MDQTVKILYLTTNQILITELVEVAAVDIGAPDCKMVNPLNNGNIIFISCSNCLFDIAWN